MTVTFKHYRNQSIQERWGGEAALLGIFRSTDSESRALFIQTQSLLIAGQVNPNTFSAYFPHYAPLFLPSRGAAVTQCPAQEIIN